MSQNFEQFADAVNEQLPKPKLTLDLTTGAELIQKIIPPARIIVEGLFVEGLIFFAARPKFGKSWLALDLCLCAADGRSFLGFQTVKCRTLYLGLEDGYRRLQNRMKKVLGDRAAPDNIHFAIHSQQTDTGLMEQLESFVKQYPDTGLIVIDTLAKVRGHSFGREGTYQTDYSEIGALKAFADEYHVALVLVTHLRKMPDETDPFNEINGTTGLTGAADAMLVLTRAKRTSETTILHSTGRDIEQQEYELKFNRETCRWENCGDVETLMEQRERERYDSSPVVKTIKKLMTQSPQREWSGKVKDLMEAGKYIAGVYLAVSGKALAQELSALERPLLENDGILHRTVKNGNAGKIHKFCYEGTPQFIEADSSEPLPF